MIGRARALAMALAVATTACGGSTPSDTTPPTSTRPVRSITSAAPTTTALAPARGDAGPLLGELIAAVPDPGIHPLLTGAFAAVNDAAENCGSLPNWTEDLRLAVTRFENLIPRVQSSPLLADWRGSAEARALSDEIRDRLVLQDRCVAGAATATDEQVRQATEVTGRAVAINDWYRIRLHELRPSVGADLWYHADHLGHMIEVERLLRAEGAIDVLVVGSSRVKHGVDALALSEATGSTVMNVGMPLMYPTVMIPWLDQVWRRGRRPGRVVIGVGASDGFRQCTEARTAKMATAIDLQARAFATLPVLEQIDQERLLVGPAERSYRDSPVLRSYLATTVPQGQGTGLTGQAPDPALIGVDRARYEDLLVEPVRCDEIVTALGSVVTDLTGRGIDVLVVGMPIHPEVRALFRDASLLDAVTSEQAFLTTAAGGRFLDLSRVLTAEQFVDLTDPTVAGRQVITDALAAELRGS